MPKLIKPRALSASVLCACSQKNSNCRLQKASVIANWEIRRFSSPSRTEGIQLSSSLKTLKLARAGNLGYSIESCSLSYMHFSSSCLMSMQIGLWILPALRVLMITKYDSLTFTEGSEPRFRPFSSLTGLTISYCKKLQNIDDLLTNECLPAIERIHIGSCPELRSLPSERFGGSTF